MSNIEVMRRAVFAFAAALTLVSCGGGSDDNSALQAMVEARWQEYSATLPVYAGGLAVYVRSPHGNRFAATEMEGASPRAHFRVASNTKTFTAASIMKLHQEGLLDIDHFITDAIPGRTEPYVPDAADYAVPYKNEITIRQLLGHRAGVFDVTNAPIPDSCGEPYAGMSYDDYVLSLDPDHRFTFDELVGVDAACQISLFEPGTGYHYSNTGYSILGKIIERVSGMAYADFVRSELLEPNRLTETSLPYLPADRTLPAPFVHGFGLAGGQVSERTEDNMSFNVAEGNIVSTPADLTVWVRALLRGEAGISKETVNMMLCEADCYGLGIMTFGAADRAYGHNGAHGGYLSYMMYYPEEDTAVVAFTTLLNFDDIATEGPWLQGVAEEAKAIVEQENAGQ